MKEITLRKWHRTMGITLASFLFLQGGSGLLLSVEEMFEHSPESIVAVSVEHGKNEMTAPIGKTYSTDNTAGHEEEGGILGQIHHENEPIWNIYRIVLGLGLLGMIFSGVSIFFKIQSRTRKTSQKQ